MTSQHIIASLRKKHADDVFVDECKNGSSYNGHSRLDAWVMNKSWSNLRFTGYEVKVSRRDFKQDDKWQEYLKLCNELYFVCPPRMLTADEIPGDAGLKYCHPSGHITVAKKAGWRECQPPMELFCYILMCRVKIVESTFGKVPTTSEDRIEKYRRFFKEKEEKREIGELVAYHVSRQWEDLKRENKNLKSRLEFVETGERILAEMGIRRSYYEIGSFGTSIRKQAEKFLQSVPETFAQELRTAKNAIELALGQIDENQSRLNELNKPAGNSK